MEVTTKGLRQLKFTAEGITFIGELKKISKGFHVVPAVALPNNLKADYVIVGSSGVWLVIIQDGSGKIIFDGDDLIQNGQVLRGLLTKAHEKSYSLAGVLKEKLGRDIIVASVVAFSSSSADAGSVPKTVRGVYIVVRKDLVPLIENTDMQLIDQNTIEEVNKILKNKK